MATAKFWQRGEALDYVNSTEDAIAANDVVVIGGHLGVAGTYIEPGAVGSMHMAGVFELPKTATSAVAMGATVYWDGNGITTTAPSGTGALTTSIGYAAAPAEASATTIMVKLNG